MIARYRKSIAALLGAVATWGVTAAADGTYGQVELWGLLAALASVVAVWGTTNAPPPADPPQVDPGPTLGGATGGHVTVHPPTEGP